MPARATGIDPKALLAIRDLELRARIIVEGFWSGLHRSPYHGFSVEFSEYRQYSPGDDLRYLDWKALARTDREYLKMYEDETNLRCLIMLDASRSMRFASAEHSKSEYARTLAATLSYFLLQQRDVVGLARFDSDLTDYIEARWRPRHFKRLLALLERQSDGAATDFAKALASLRRLCRKRSLIVVISDFLSDPVAWQSQLAHLSAAGHDMRAIQVLDPAESSLDFGEAAHWEDIESGHSLYVDPDTARAHYLERFQTRQEAVANAFKSLAIPHQLVATDEPLDKVLLSFVKNVRMQGGRSHGRRQSR